MKMVCDRPSLLRTMFKTGATIAQATAELRAMQASGIALFKRAKRGEPDKARERPERIVTVGMLQVGMARAALGFLQGTYRRRLGKDAASYRDDKIAELRRVLNLSPN